MTAPLAVPAAERGVVRVFAVDLPEAEARAFAADPAAVARALGAEGLDAAHVDVFPVSRVAPLGLPLFLEEGHGVAASDTAPQAEALDALEGHVALVTSGAFRGEARSLHVAPPLRLVGTFREERAPVAFGALPAAGADGAAPPDGDAGAKAPQPAPVRRGRLTNRALTLLILVVAVVGFILLNGGR
jgi:hypothetical protein